MAHLRTVTVAQLQSRWASLYKPANAQLLVMGKAAEGLRSEIEKAFGSIAAGNKVGARAPFPDTVLGRTETVEISGVGSITGSLTVKIASSGLITITTANLTFNDGSTSQAVALADVASDPVGNANFVPQSGTASFSVSEGDATTTLVVTFNASTPTDGGVDVAFGTTGSASHTIPLP